MVEGVDWIRWDGMVRRSGREDCIGLGEWIGSSEVKWSDGLLGNGPHESVFSIAEGVIVEPGFHYRMIGQ